MQDYKADFEMVSEFFEALANYIVDGEGAHSLMKIAVENGFSKDECLNWFIDDENLYNQVLKEVKERK